MPGKAQHLAEELVAATPPLDEEQQRLALALYGLLAEGEPVARERLADRAAVASADLAPLLDGLPGVYHDELGRVIGFWGMSLSQMPHRMHVNGRAVHAWCAWDTLFLPELLGTVAIVDSTCPTTGEAIRLVVTPEEVRELSPAGAVLSFLRPDTSFGVDTIKSFCHFIHFFASREAAEQWTAEHEGTFVISIDEGFEIARRANRARFSTALPTTSGSGVR